MSNYNSQLQSNNTDLQAILNSINELPEAGGEQAAPVILINSATGLITATAGTKSSTHQLAFQPAKTIAPSTASQIAVSSGYYTGGNVMVAGDANLVASNIKSGVSIFGVNGTLESGGGEAAEWSENEDAIVGGTISIYTNDRVTTIGSYAFQNCRNLTTISFPVVTSIGSYAFQGCFSLTTVSFPAATRIGSYAFCDCRNLTTISFPVVTSIDSYAFQSCSNLTAISFPTATSIGGNAFQYCSSLTTVSFPVATSIGRYAFCDCSTLTIASFPVAKDIGDYVFYYCRGLTTVSFPAATRIGSYAFQNCDNLTVVNFPATKRVGNNAFQNCRGLTTVSFPAATHIGSYAFKNCYNLSELYLGAPSVCTLSNSNAFLSTPYAGYSAYFSGTPYIYVPASLLTSYQTATNWTYFSSRFVGI